MNLSSLGFPFCLSAFNRNLADVERLLRVAPTRATHDWEPRRSAEAVYRSAVVLACAAWEAFIEDLALDALQRIEKRYRDGEQLGALAQEPAARTSRILDLHRLSWRYPRLVQQKRDVLLGAFNTPKAAAVDGLFRRTLDIERFSSAWYWPKASSAAVLRRLDTFVALRGDIAHRTKSRSSVTKADVREWDRFLQRLAVLSCNELRTWLVAGVPGAPAPWDRIPLSVVA